ncbi:MAG: hypothetical protein HQ462_05915 [Deltaproteobacteria bacterium]|nr:hypothetical protein [Deltaproteobacteria bacterium]
MRNLKHIFSKAALFYLIGCRLLIPRICLANHDSMTLPSFVKSISSPQISFNTSGLFKEIRANLKDLKTLDDEYSQNPANAKKTDSKEAPNSEIQATYEKNKEEFDSKIKEVIEKLKKQLGELRKNSLQSKSSEKKDLEQLIGLMEKAISEHSQKVATKTETSEITDKVKNKKKRTPKEKQALQDQIKNLRDSILNHAESGDSFGNQLAEQYKETLSQLTKLEKELNSNQIALEKISNNDHSPYKSSPPSDEEDSLSNEGTENAGSITPNIPSVVRKSQPPSDSTSLTPTHNSSGNSSDSFAINENSNISPEKPNAPILNPNNKNNTFAAPSRFIQIPTVNSLAQNPAVFPGPTAPITPKNFTNNFYTTTTASASAAVPTIDNPPNASPVDNPFLDTSNTKARLTPETGFNLDVSLRKKDPNTPNEQLKYVRSSDSNSNSLTTSNSDSLTTVGTTSYDSYQSNLGSNESSGNAYNSENFSVEDPSEFNNRQIASVEYTNNNIEVASYDFRTVSTLEDPVKNDRLTQILKELQVPSVPTDLSSDISTLLEKKTESIKTKKSFPSIAGSNFSDSAESRGPSLFDRFVAWLGI